MRMGSITSTPTKDELNYITNVITVVKKTKNPAKRIKMEYYNMINN